MVQYLIITKENHERKRHTPPYTAMLIEKISDMEIRTVLTERELKSRGISCDTFAYDTDEARSLFSEIVSQATFQTGFEPGDYPLTIEAVPLPDGGMAVDVVKSDDPEELDARFSRFSPDVRAGNLELPDVDADDVDDLSLSDNGRSFADMLKEAADIILGDNGSSPFVQKREESHVYRMKGIGDLIDAARRMQNALNSPSTVWKGRDGSYLLTFARGALSDDELLMMDAVCAEYGERLDMDRDPSDFGYEIFIKEAAIGKLFLAS